MVRQPVLVLAFAIAFAVLLLSPAFLRQALPFYSLMEVGDATDIVTPLVLLPLYWLLLRHHPEGPPGTAGVVLFLLLAAAWVEGQGMHLAANSIGHLLEGAAGTDAQALTHFYDEVLGHYLWHIGIMGLSALLAWRHWNGAIAGGVEHVAVGAAAVIYGATFFIIVIEGGTVPAGLPFAAVMAAAGLGWGRRRLVGQPVVGLFGLGYLLSVVLFIAWAARWGGFPQFSEVGIID